MRPCREKRGRAGESVPVWVWPRARSFLGRWPLGAPAYSGRYRPVPGAALCGAICVSARWRGWRDWMEEAGRAMVLLSARLLEINLFGCQPDPFASKPYGSRAGQVPSGFTSFLWFDVVGSAACTRQTSTVSPIRVGARVASHLHISTTWGEAAQFAGRDGVKPVSGPWPDRGGRPGGGHGAGEEKFFALVGAH